MRVFENGKKLWRPQRQLQRYTLTENEKNDIKNKLTLKFRKPHAKPNNFYVAKTRSITKPQWYIEKNFFKQYPNVKRVIKGVNFRTQEEAINAAKKALLQARYTVHNYSSDLVGISLDSRRRKTTQTPWVIHRTVVNPELSIAFHGGNFKTQDDAAKVRYFMLTKLLIDIKDQKPLEGPYSIVRKITSARAAVAGAVAGPPFKKPRGSELELCAKLSNICLRF